MKNWLKQTSNRILVCILFVLVSVVVVGTLTENYVLLQWSKSLLIPVFVVYFFFKNKTLNPFFWVFIISSLFGDMLLVVDSEKLSYWLSGILFSLSYVSLVCVALPKLKNLNTDKVVGAYLMIVATISIFFLHRFFVIFKEIVPNVLDVAVIGFRMVSLVALALVALVAYLHLDTKKSILFLLVALCFVFSDVLHYISVYYIYNWSFEILDKVMCVLGLFLLFSYIVDDTKEKTSNSLTELENNREEEQMLNNTTYA